jgi:hypothetical protein
VVVFSEDFFFASVEMAARFTGGDGSQRDYAAEVGLRMYLIMIT